MFSFVNNLIPKNKPDDGSHTAVSQILPPALDAAEENSLVEQLGTDKHEEAQKLLISHNLGLVEAIAKKNDNSGVSEDDLIAVGTIGLIKAVNTYRKDKDNNFTSYISRGIEAEIMQHLEMNNEKIYNESEDEAFELEDEACKSLLSEIYGMESAKKDIKRLAKAIGKLHKRERQIIELRYGIGEHSGHEMTVKEVADYLHISQSYICRMEKKIIWKLRQEIM